MTDAGLVLHKLQRLKAQISLTRARRPAAADVLSHDLVLRDALALAFLVALQEAIDIAYHVVADEGWGFPIRIGQRSKCWRLTACSRPIG